MATTSDAGDPPDPSKVNTTTNAQSTNAPVVHSATASSILTKNDGEPGYFVIVDDDDEDEDDDAVNSDRSAHHNEISDPRHQFTRSP